MNEIVMSAGKHHSSHVTKKVRKKLRKKRHVSLTYLAVHKGPYFRSQTDQYQCTSFPLMDLHMSDGDITQSSEFPMDTDEYCTNFPFQLLPELCKYKVWSFLSQCDLGRCMLVCSEWYHLIKNPYLWSTIHLSSLPYSCLPRDHSAPVHTESTCHLCFRKRVFVYSQFLSNIHPVVRELKFSLDLSYTTDQFSCVVEQFMTTAELRSLTRANMNWMENPSGSPLKASQESFQDCMYRYRKRQRIFCRLFDQFVSLVSCLTTLMIPFDWTETNVQNLCSLTSLENLVLEKYGIYNHIFTQDHMNMMTRSLVCLKRLYLEVWIPTCNSRGMEVYYIESASLKWLDLSQCRGFYLKRVRMPNLQEILIDRNPLKISWVHQQSPILLCMCSVLSAGAPKLQCINKHSLESENLHLPSVELTNLMSKVCCCLQHWKSNDNDIEVADM